MNAQLARVLVVDDEYVIRLSLKEYLEDFDFETGEADSAEAALEMLHKASFDVALVDLRLPGMSGEAFVLEAHRISPNMKFIIQTGSVGYQISDQLLGIGVDSDCVINKPVIRLQTVVEKINQLIGKTR